MPEAVNHGRSQLFGSEGVQEGKLREDGGLIEIWSGILNTRHKHQATVRLHYTDNTVSGLPFVSHSLAGNIVERLETSLLDRIESLKSIQMKPVNEPYYYFL